MAMLVPILIFCLVVGLILWLIDYLPLPAPFGMVVRVVIVVLAIVWLIERFAPFSLR